MGRHRKPRDSIACRGPSRRPASLSCPPRCSVPEPRGTSSCSAPNPAHDAPSAVHVFAVRLCSTLSVFRPSSDPCGMDPSRRPSANRHPDLAQQCGIAAPGPLAGEDTTRESSKQAIANPRYNRSVTQPIAHRTTHLPADYAAFLAEVKTRIAAARTRAVLAVNSELIKLYWEIGHEILERERLEGWGAKVIDRLATDLRRDFPEMTGLSRANLHHMRRFADAWPGENADAIVQQPVRQLPWGQNIALLTKLKDRDTRPGTPLRLSGMSAVGLHLLMKLISLVRNDPPPRHPHLDRPCRAHAHRVREHTPGRSQPEPGRYHKRRALSSPLPPRGSRRVRAAICRRRAAGGRLARLAAPAAPGGSGPQPDPPIPSNLPAYRWERSTAQPRRADAPPSDTVTRSRLERAGWVALIALAPATLIYLCFNAGGYFPSATGFVAVVLAEALVLRTTLAERPFEGLDRALAIPLVGLALYAAFTLASALWSHATAHSLDSFSRTLLYVLALALVRLRSLHARARWPGSARGGGGARLVCIVGLVSRVLPHTWPTTSGFFADRLNYPLTYWNAEGMVAAIVLVLGFHLTADRAEHPGVRVAAAAVLPAVGATLLLTFSRGAMGAGAVGLLAYCLLTRFSTLPRPACRALPPVAIAMRSAWNATALATTHPTSPLAISQGHHVAVVVGRCVAGAPGLLRAALLLARRRRIAGLGLVRTPPRRSVRVGVIAGAAGVVVVAVAACPAGGAGLCPPGVQQIRPRHPRSPHGPDPRPAHRPGQQRSPAAVEGGPEDLPDAEAAGDGCGHLPAVLPALPHRKSVCGRHPLALPAEPRRARDRRLRADPRCRAGGLGGLAARIRGPDRPIYAALFAAWLAWAMHQGFDWDWQMPAVTLGMFMLAGLALARPRDGKVGPLRPAGRAHAGGARLAGPRRRPPARGHLLRAPTAQRGRAPARGMRAAPEKRRSPRCRCRPSVRRRMRSSACATSCRATPRRPCPR